MYNKNIKIYLYTPLDNRAVKLKGLANEGKERQLVHVKAGNRNYVDILRAVMS